MMDDGLNPNYSASSASGEVPTRGKMAILRPSYSQLLVGRGTPIACTQCHRINMPAYYLKRVNGLYALLCYENGKGCWERSDRGLCSHIDHAAGGTQCDYLAEYVVVYGEGNSMTRRAVCSAHVGASLSDAPVYRIYPLDDDRTGHRAGSGVQVGTYTEVYDPASEPVLGSGSSLP